MKKKYFLLILSLICGLGLLSCNDNNDESNEFIIKDKNLTTSTIVDDNNRVFYEIFTGSFSDSNGDGVGDLRGIINRLDYLNDGDPNSGKSLGIQGIWLTPIFKSPTYHKYDVSDYYTIDPAFGDMDDLKDLISECHKRGIKLILDLVLNHTSLQNEWFKKFKTAHVNNDETDPYYDFYSYLKKGEAISFGKFNMLSGTTISYECNFVNEMPELNYDNEEVRKAVLDIAKYYLDLGIDGFRFDAAKYIYYGNDEKSADFWNWYLTELRKIKSDIYTVGEVWSDESTIDVYYQQGLNCFNFSFSQFDGKISNSARMSKANGFVSYVEKYNNKIKEYSSDNMMIPFIANHDTDRAAGFLNVDGNAQMAANLYILTPGSPFIYYGEEIGIKGSRGSESTDANRRLAMLWGDDDTINNPIGSTYNPEYQTNGTVKDQLLDSSSLYNHYKRLIMIRNANPEIARGEFKALNSDNSDIGGFISTYNGSSVCVIHNTSKEAITINITTLTTQTFNSLRSYVGMNDAVLNGTTLTIGGQTSVILK